MIPARVAALFAVLLSACNTVPPESCIPTRDDAGRIARSRLAINEFKRLNPCPATGKPSGACPGFVVDHIKPLCACGADHHSNMQWQTVADAKIKDREERKLCGVSWEAEKD